VSTQFLPHVEGTIENCWRFERNADECLECALNGYYLNGTACASMSTPCSPFRRHH
jgi:hypothetical protein